MAWRKPCWILVEIDEGRVRINNALIAVTICQVIQTKHPYAWCVYITVSFPVFRQGDIGTNWYAVLAGSLDVKVSETSSHQVIYLVIKNSDRCIITVVFSFLDIYVLRISFMTTVFIPLPVPYFPFQLPVSLPFSFSNWWPCLQSYFFRHLFKSTSPC